jgi:hypothetical protein
MRVTVVKVPRGFARECGLEVGTAPGGTVVLSPRELHLLMAILQRDPDQQVLSRPSLITLDGRTASVQIGQTVPAPGAVRPACGLFGPNPEPTVVAGLTMTVTPKLSADGTAAMLRVTAEHTELKAVLGNFVVTGPGVLIPAAHVEPRPAFAVCGASGKATLPLGHTAVFRIPEGGRSFTGAVARACGLDRFETLVIVTPSAVGPWRPVVLPPVRRR